MNHPTFSIEENKKFVYELERLKAHHVWFLINNSQLPFEEIVGVRVRFYANAYRESDSQWNEWRSACYDKYKSHGDNPNTEKLEEWAVEKDAPFIEKNISSEYEKEWLAPLEFPFFGFSYEFIPKYGEQESPDFLTLHFRNYFWPDSPFKHIPELRDGISKLLAQAKRERPDVKNVQCGTWLNSLEFFRGLFPDAWHKNAVPGKAGGHMGWWGQFMDRRGALHKKNAEILRKTGCFPYKHLLCHCSIDELI